MSTPTRRILVVEDDALQRRLVGRILTRGGYAVTTAKDGLEGVQSAWRQRPDAVVTDVLMPELDGYQVCRVLKEDPATRDVPVIVLTALEARIDRFWADESGADRFVNKQDVVHALLPALDEVLTSRAPLPAEAPEAAPADAGTIRSRVNRMFQRLLLEQTIVNRFRRILAEGMEPEPAARAILDTLEQLVEARACALSMCLPGAEALFVRGDVAADEGVLERLAPGAGAPRVLPGDARDACTCGAPAADGLPWSVELVIAGQRVGRLGLLLCAPAGAAQRMLEVARREVALVVGAVTEVARRRALEASLEQAARFRGIGQLAAGCAHEMNSPAQYLSDNLHFLREAFDEIAPALEALHGAAKDAAAPLPPAWAGVTRAAQAIDLEFLREEVPQALRQASEGLRQIAAIIGVLKGFSASAGGSRSAVDLDETIRATGTVSRNAFGEHVVVEMDLQAGRRVEIEVDEFKGVLLDLLLNAAEAIERRCRPGPPRGTIRISTAPAETGVRLSIQDDGAGMDTSVLERAFEPFFTTKDVGQGTGNGLSHARAFVERHGGSIRLESAVGCGTAVHVELPAHAPVAAPVPG